MIGSPLQRIYQLKLALVGILALLAGVILSVLADELSAKGHGGLAVAAISSLSDLLVVTGGIGIAVDFFTGRDKAAADTERTRLVLKELTSEFTDAVVKGFAVTPEDLRRVATPDLLDQIATNVLSLRLGDADFAGEVYREVRDQAIRAPERWRDVEVSVRLSEGAERPIGPRLFDVLVEWEYTTVPSQPLQRFACVSDRDEFYELTTDVPATSTWFMTPRPGLDASSRVCFELLYFAVDGEERSVRRSARKTGQTYSATIGEDVVRAGQPVRIKHIYRVVTPQSGHRLFFEIAQPACDVSLELDYSHTSISHLSVTDMVTSTQKPRVTRLPDQVSPRALSIDVPGWLLPKAGFTFVWTLAAEESLPKTSADPLSGRSKTPSRLG